jgi:PAS domain-containing protein
MHEHLAYVIGDLSGACVYATPAALAMLGTDQDRLRDLRLADLSGLDRAPDQLRERLAASSGQIDRWLAGDMELRCPDGSRSTVEFSLVRRAGGEVIIRFHPSDSSHDASSGAIREILEAWRRHEQAAVRSMPGTPARLVAEAEIERLSGEYQRVALELAQAYEAAERGR